jgi:hypothetical protein
MGDFVSDKYEFVLFRPGISGFHKKSGEPLGFPPEATEFEAKSPTEARTLAMAMYYQTGLGFSGHYNISRVAD